MNIKTVTRSAVKKAFSLFLTATVVVFNLGAQSQHRMGSTAFPINDNVQSNPEAAVQGGWEINGFGKVTTMHRVNATTLYACTASGGIYKSNDNGANWRSLTGSFLPAVQMGCIAVSPADTNVLYAGTGEVDYAENYDWGGYGVFKSTNGGATWQQLNNGMGLAVVTDLLINPNNPNWLVASTKNGVFLTTNGGANWTLPAHSATYVHQLLQRGTSDTILGVSDNRFFISTDWGSSWQQNDLDPTTSSQYINGRIAIAPTNHNVVYVSFIMDSTWGNTDQAEVFKSVDGGASFTKTYYAGTSPALSSYDGIIGDGGFGWANWCMVVSPTDPQTLYTGAHLIFKSTDGGNSFTQVLTNWWCCVHTDIHQMAFDPSNNNTLWAATDGGIFVSADAGADWQPSSNGLVCSQYYSFGQSNVDSTFVIGGTQDNAVMYLNDDGNVHTYDGGDYSDFILCDYFNPHNSYTSNAPGYIFDPYNRANSAMLNLPDEIQDATEPGMVFSPLFAGKAFCYGDTIWVTSNLGQYSMDASGGTSSIAWEPLTGFEDQTVLALAISPVNDNLIYFITDSNLFYTCTLIGNGLSSISSVELPTPSGVTASIAVSTLNPNVIYISANNKVYRSANGGANWTDLTGNLPNINFQSVFIDPYSTIEGIYLVTDLGVYYTGWTVAGWVNLNAGFPDSLQNASATFYQPIAGAGLFKGSNSATSHVAMGTWGAGFQEVSFYSQLCNALTDNWQLINITNTFSNNSACYDNTYASEGGSTSITVTASSTTIGGSSDQFAMVAGQFVNNGSITCSLLSIAQNTNDTLGSPCESGLMIRADSLRGAPFVMVGVDGFGRPFIRQRASTGATAVNTYLSTPIVPYPDSLRLVRQGDTITVYTNFDNNGVWANNGQIIIPLGDTIIAGIAADAGTSGTINRSAFSVPVTTGFNQLNTGVERVAANTPSLYPDPAHNIITVKLMANTSLTYIITDILGQRVMSGVTGAGISEQKIDISNLAAGNYLVNFIDKQQNCAGKARFIKD